MIHPPEYYDGLPAVEAVELAVEDFRKALVSELLNQASMAWARLESSRKPHHQSVSSGGHAAFSEAARIVAELGKDPK